MIDLEELRLHESAQVEWKANVADWRDVVRTLVAFANDLQNLGGGYVVCGAHEAKDEHGFPRVEVAGLTASRFKEIKGKVLDACRDHVFPSLAPRVEELPGPDASTRVLLFLMPATSQVHAFAGGPKEEQQTWIRVNDQTVVARNGLLRELQVQKGALEPFDHRPCSDATVDDLDLVALRDTLVRLKVWDAKLGVEAWLQPDRRMSPLMPALCAVEPLTGVLRPRNFALLLFGHEPQRHFTYRHAQFEVYPGRNRGADAVESQWLTGTLIRQAERLIELLELHAPDIHDKVNLKHPNIESFPRRALKEAVVNAIVHRDYALGHPVLVTMFEDRVEIHSPGGLPRALDRQDFEAGRAPPSWRNQALAWVFKELHLAQAAGQGIPTILRDLEGRGYPPPSFALGPESVTCVIPAHPRHLELREAEALRTTEAAGMALVTGQEDLRAAVSQVEQALIEAGLLVEGAVVLIEHQEERYPWRDVLAWRNDNGRWQLVVEGLEYRLDAPEKTRMEYRSTLDRVDDSILAVAVDRLPDLIGQLNRNAEVTARKLRNQAETVRRLTRQLRARPSEE